MGKGKKGKNKKGKQNDVLVTTKEAAGAAAAVGGAAGSALLVHPGTPAGLALAAALLALFPPVVAMMTEATARRMRARADRFFQTIVDEWARDEQKTPEEVAARLEERKDDPEVSDAIWRAVRALMEAPNDAAAVPLGILAAEYGRDRRPTDTFFRGTVRLLAELSREETAELRGVLAWVLDSTRRSYVTLLANNMREAGGITHERVPWYLELRRDDPNRPDEPDMAINPWIRYAAPPQDVDRLFALLKTTGLGSEPTLGVMGAAVLVELRREVTERLVRLLQASGGC